MKAKNCGTLFRSFPFLCMSQRLTLCGSPCEFYQIWFLTKTTECRSLFQLRSDISGLGRWRLFLKLEIKCNTCPAHSLLWYPAQSFAFVAADTDTLETTFVHFAINSCKTNLRCRSEECIHKNLKNCPENLLVTQICKLFRLEKQ